MTIHCNVQYRKASKVLTAILILCAMVTACWPAQAIWEPDEVYNSAADLPEEVQVAIPKELIYLYGSRVGDTIGLFLGADNDTFHAYIFIRTGDAYRLDCVSAPLPVIDGVMPSIDCGGNELNILYNSYPPVFNAYFFFQRNSVNQVWELCGVMGDDIFSITSDFVFEGMTYGDGFLHGAYRFDRDVTTVNISELPRNFADALALVDTDGYAMVKSDKSTDRLHLRTAPSTDAASIGRYFSGTPVRILEDRGEWAKVSVAGVEGYMMKKFLAFGQEMLHVERWFPSKQLIEEDAELGVNVYAGPNTNSAVTGVFFDSSLWAYLILANVGDGWYHVLCDDGFSGYVEVRHFWDGNG